MVLVKKTSHHKTVKTVNISEKKNKKTKRTNSGMMVQMKETLPATEVKTCCLDIDFRK